MAVADITGEHPHTSHTRLFMTHRLSAMTRTVRYAREGGEIDDLLCTLADNR